MNKINAFALLLVSILFTSAANASSPTPSKQQSLAERDQLLLESEKAAAALKKIQIMEEILKGRKLGAEFLVVTAGIDGLYEFTKIDSDSVWSKGKIKIGDRLAKVFGKDLEIFDVVTLIYLSKYGGPISVLREGKLVELRLPSVESDKK